MKTQTTKEQFLMTSFKLLSSTKLNHTQKAFISYILGWQSNNLVCFETNKALAKVFGLSVDGIRYTLKSLNKFEFFTSTRYGVKENIKSDDYTSTHEIKVDEELLNQFLSDSTPIAEPEPKAKPSIKPEPLQPVTVKPTPKSFIEEIEEDDDEPYIDLSTDFGKELVGITLVSNESKHMTRDLAEALAEQTDEQKLKAKQKELGYSDKKFAEFLADCGITI